MLRPAILLGCLSYLWSLSHWEAGVIKQLVFRQVIGSEAWHGHSRHYYPSVPTTIDSSVERECHNVGTPYTHQSF